MTWFIVLSLLSTSVFAGKTGTWSGSTTHQFFPTIIQALLGNGYALIPSQALYGGGFDGAETVGNVNVTLTRDMYWSSLAWSAAATGQILSENQRIYVSGTCDFTNAPAGAINASGGNGGNGNAASGAAGSTGSHMTAGTLGAGGTGGAAGAGTTTAGGAGATAGANTGNGGGNSSAGSGGSGGVAGVNAGGAGGGQRFPTTAPYYDAFQTTFTTGASSNQVGSGIAGSGGGGGGGDGVSPGGGGGGPGGSAGTLYISCYHIIFGASTPSGIIQANGGNGGNGATPTSTCTNGCGGGGGGSGAGGGWVQLRYDFKTGTVVTSAIQANPGAGSTAGSGKNGGATGQVGVGGFAGTVTLYNMRLGTNSTTVNTAGVTL